jgi:hypothetical protein
MIRTILAIVTLLCVSGGCAESMQPAQAMTDEQRCVSSGGIWRDNTFCEAPSGPHTGKR